MKIKNLIEIIIISSFFLISCSDEKKDESSYKKKTDIPYTGQSIEKKNNPNKKVTDFY